MVDEQTPAHPGAETVDSHPITRAPEHTDVHSQPDLVQPHAIEGNQTIGKPAADHTQEPARTSSEKDHSGASQEKPETQSTPKPVHTPLTLGGGKESTPGPRPGEALRPTSGNDFFRKLGVEDTPRPSHDHSAASPSNEPLRSETSHPDVDNSSEKSIPTGKEHSGVLLDLGKDASEFETAVALHRAMFGKPEAGKVGVHEESITISADPHGPIPEYLKKLKLGVPQEKYLADIRDTSSTKTDPHQDFTVEIKYISDPHEMARQDVLAQRTPEGRLFVNEQINRDGQDSHWAITELDRSGSTVRMTAVEVFPTDKGYQSERPTIDFGFEKSSHSDEPIVKPETSTDPGLVSPGDGSPATADTTVGVEPSKRSRFSSVLDGDAAQANTPSTSSNKPAGPPIKEHPEPITPGFDRLDGVDADPKGQ
jgi:hypothetical protein